MEISMENPDDRDPVASAIADAIRDYYMQRDRGFVGPSLPLCIAAALREKCLVGALSLDEYQWRSNETAIYPEHGSGKYNALAYVALGLGEVGELQGKVKKIQRDGFRDNAAMAGELGDILWYVAQFATEIQMSLAACYICVSGAALDVIPPTLRS